MNEMELLFCFSVLFKQNNIEMGIWRSQTGRVFRT